MLSQPSDYKHIAFDAHGRAVIEGTRYKVRMLGLEHEQHGWSAEELKWQHPDLTLGQIHAALSFYHDHLSAMHEETAAATRLAEDMRASSQQPTREELERRLKTS